jgi:hypothetical protein
LQVVASEKERKMTLTQAVLEVNKQLDIAGFIQNPQLEGSTQLFTKPFLKI